MFKILRQQNMMKCKYVHSYTQETHTLIYISKYSSAFIVLWVRLTQYQKIHTDIPSAEQQMFTYFVHID